MYNDESGSNCFSRLTEKEVTPMAKNEKTSPKVATTASKQLSNPKTSKAGKSVAGSALTQARDRK